MRKDLKIGMAIGAVLLVVLIVYIAVPKNPSGDVAHNDETVQLQTDGGETGNGAATEETTTPPAGTETPAELPVASNDTGTSDVFSPDSEATPTAGETAAAGQTNWDLLLTTGEMPKTVTPSLRATNTVAPTTPAAPTGTEAPAVPATPEVTTAADGTPTGTTGTATDDAADTTAKPAGEQTESTPKSAEESPTASDTTTLSPAGGRSHTVKSGETFSSIAKAAYNDSRHYLAIEAANPTVNPKRLRPGTVITLPDLDAAETASAKIAGDGSSSSTATETAKTTKALDPKTEYKVKSGDSLYKIAVAVYGSSNMVDDLYEANKQTIGADSSKLKLGMVLKLPPNPNAQASSR